MQQHELGQRVAKKIAQLENDQPFSIKSSKDFMVSPSINMTLK